MHFEAFKDSLSAERPPQGLDTVLEALWYAGKDNWDKAHDMVDGLPSNNASWVHAYLHRWEGDQWNANYWYRRAGKTMPSFTLEEEWEQLVQALL